MLTDSELADLAVTRAAVKGICWRAARRELAERRAGAGCRLTAAEQAAGQAETMHTPLADQLAGLETRLADASRRLAEARQAEDTEDDVEKLQAVFMRRAALEKTEQKLAGKVTAARRGITPFTQALAAARDDLDTARQVCADLDTAIGGQPFAHPLSRETASYTQWLALSGEWLAHLHPGERNTAAGVAARAVIMHALHASHLGHEIEQRVENGVRAEYGNSDDPRVGFLPDGTPVVNSRHATRRDLFTAPDIRPADTRSGEQLMRQMRHDAGGWENTPGLYVRPDNPGGV